MRELLEPIAASVHPQAYVGTCPVSNRAAAMTAVATNGHERPIVARPWDIIAFAYAQTLDPPCNRRTLRCINAVRTGRQRPAVESVPSHLAGRIADRLHLQRRFVPGPVGRRHRAAVDHARSA